MRRRVQDRWSPSQEKGSNHSLYHSMQSVHKKSTQTWNIHFQFQCILFNSHYNPIEPNETTDIKRGNGCLLWRGDRDPQIRRNLPSRSERENPAHRNQTRYNRDACMNREKKIAKNERIRSWPERRSVRGWRIRRTEGKCEEREGFFDCWSSEPLWGRRKRWRENWRKKLIFSGKWKGEFEWKGEGKRIEIFRVRGIWFSDLKYVMRTG